MIFYSYQISCYIVHDLTLKTIQKWTCSEFKHNFQQFDGQELENLEDVNLTEFAHDIHFCNSFVVFMCQILTYFALFLFGVLPEDLSCCQKAKKVATN